MDRNERAYWIEIVGLAILSAVLFRFGLLLVVFLLPLQVAWVRRGERAGLTASGLFLVMLAGLKLVDYLRIRSAMPEGGAGMVFLDIALPVGFLIGLYLLNVPVFRIEGIRNRQPGTATRLALALVAGLVVYGAAILVVQATGAADVFIEAQTTVLRSLLSASNATDEEIRQLTDVVITVFLSGFLFVYLGMLAGTWWIGTRIALRSRFLEAESNPVADRLRSMVPSRFRLPNWFVWAVVLSLALLVITLRVDAGWFAFVVRNALLVVLGLYALQGVSIIWFLLEKRKVSRGGRIGIAVALIMGVLIPGLNLVVMLGLPGLGISEVWVNYHRFERSGEK